MDLQLTYPAKLRLAERRITNRRVAEVARVSPSSVGRALNGFIRPSPAVVRACEELTGLDRAELFPPDAPVMHRALAELVREAAER